MARRIKAEVGGLNIRIHPHSEEKYRELFQAAFVLKKIVPMRGDRSGLITSLEVISQNSLVINGVLTTFLELDTGGNWLNIETLKDASDVDVQEIRIPAYLRPNKMSFYFQFDVKNHQIIIEHYGSSKRLTHSAAFAFFRGLFDDKELIRRFGDVKLSIIQSTGSVDRIFEIPRITHLKVYIERPNSDIWPDDFEELAEEHLGDKHARSMTVEYEANAGDGIQRDDDLNALVRTSVRNGRTVARGYGPNGHMRATTDEYPKVEQVKYDTDEMSDNQAFRYLAGLFRRK